MIILLCSAMIMLVLSTAVECVAIRSLEDSLSQVRKIQIDAEESRDPEKIKNMNLDINTVNHIQGAEGGAETANINMNPLKLGKDYYMLIPVQDALRTARDVNSGELWEMPGELILSDGTRAININNLEKKSAVKRKSEKDIESPAKASLAVSTGKLFSVERNGGEQQCGSCENGAVSLPINLDFRISNLIPPNLVNDVEIKNCSYVDSDGNVAFNIQISKSQQNCNPPLNKTGYFQKLFVNPNNTQKKNPEKMRYPQIPPKSDTKTTIPNRFGIKLLEEINKIPAKDKLETTTKRNLFSQQYQKIETTGTPWIMKQFEDRNSQSYQATALPNLLNNPVLLNQLEKAFKEENNMNRTNDDKKVVGPNQSRQIHPSMIQIKKKKAIADAIELLAKALGKKPFVGPYNLQEQTNNDK